MKTRNYLAIIATMILTLWAMPAVATEPSPSQVTRIEAAIAAVCPLLEQEAVLVQEIAVEKRNPAGVVDLRRLHELGELLQFTRGQLRQARAEEAEGLRLFWAWTHRALDLGYCQARDAD